MPQKKELKFNEAEFLLARADALDVFKRFHCLVYSFLKRFRCSADCFVTERGTTAWTRRTLFVKPTRHLQEFLFAARAGNANRLRGKQIVGKAHCRRK